MGLACENVRLPFSVVAPAARVPVVVRAPLWKLNAPVSPSILNKSPVPGREEVPVVVSYDNLKSLPVSSIASEYEYSSLVSPMTTPASPADAPVFSTNKNGGFEASDFMCNKESGVASLIPTRSLEALTTRVLVSTVRLPNVLKFSSPKLMSPPLAVMVRSSLEFTESCACPPVSYARANCAEVSVTESRDIGEVVPIPTLPELPTTVNLSVCVPTTVAAVVILKSYALSKIILF